MPDVILMDINLPGIDGIAATAKVIEALPTVQVIMLSVQGGDRLSTPCDDGRRTRLPDQAAGCR